MYGQYLFDPKKIFLKPCILTNLVLRCVEHKKSFPLLIAMQSSGHCCNIVVLCMRLCRPLSFWPLSGLIFVILADNQDKHIISYKVKKMVRSSQPCWDYILLSLKKKGSVTRLAPWFLIWFVSHCQYRTTVTSVDLKICLLEVVQVCYQAHIHGKFHIKSEMKMILQKFTINNQNDKSFQLPLIFFVPVGLFKANIHVQIMKNSL